MTFEVIGEISEQAKQLLATGEVPAGLEDELDACFEEVAQASLATAGGPGSTGGPGSAGPSRTPSGGSKGTGGSPAARLSQLSTRVTMLARRRLGPALRGLERRSDLSAARAGEAAATQAHVAVDHLERLVARSPLASRALSAARPGGATASGADGIDPTIEGPLLEWVLDRLSGAGSPEQVREGQGLVLHAECGDGRIIEELAARGLDARGADPRRSARAAGDTIIVAAGALEYLGATPSDTLDGLLLTGVVDRLRPGAARALAQLAAGRLASGGVVVLVSARPEAAASVDPVVADLAPGRPLHPVTWCHLLARYGLSELAVFEPDASEPDIFAVSARRRVSVFTSANDSP
jgi:hypothetical protein